MSRSTGHTRPSPHAGTLLVSTCGTSVLTNRLPGAERGFVQALTNRRRDGISADDLARLDGLIDGAVDTLLASTPAEAMRLSAELNGILSWVREEAAAGRATGPLHHVLVASDTHLGRRTRDGLARWLAATRGDTVMDLGVVGGLATSSLADLRAALPDLVRDLTGLGDVYHARGMRVVFNLTGGFKSVNGFVQALGMTIADECVYIFDGGADLMRIPRLPLRLDPDGIVAEHADAFRRMAERIALPLADCAGLPETLLFIDGDTALLSEWGEMLWTGCRPALERGSLLAPIDPRLLEIGAVARRTAEGYSADRLAIVNRRLADLERHLRASAQGDRGATNPVSLDFKSITNPADSARTHEFDLFHDQDAKRGYGHFRADGCFVITAFDRHL